MLGKDKGVRIFVKALDILQDTLSLQAVIIGKGTMETRIEAACERQRIGGAHPFPGAMQQSALVRF